MSGRRTPMGAFREAGIEVVTLDGLDVSEGIDTYHLAENYGISGRPGRPRADRCR
ncbi:hypothetical protein [Streptomyces aquilus]|uniref:hypothetical protein n=1 Tax=Streptomyces aquilus TaxID=2548456 RepID=UPI0014170B6E|nr:hypothetical protein [Streptomyces aquilus]